jgi:acyl carrier protein
MTVTPSPKRDPAAVESAVRAAIAVVAPGKDGVASDAELMAQVGLSSLQVMDMVMEIEDQLDLSVPVNVLGEVRTIGQLTAALIKLSEEPKP